MVAHEQRVRILSIFRLLRLGIAFHDFDFAAEESAVLIYLVDGKMEPAALLDAVDVEIAGEIKDRTDFDWIIGPRWGRHGKESRSDERCANQVFPPS
jgi:hypothetical protein